MAAPAARCIDSDIRGLAFPPSLLRRPVAGAVIGVLMALSTPHKYYAESRLFVDPREIRVTEDDVRNQQLSTEAMLAIIDSQLQILSSTSVLEKVIADLGLDRDPEFNGSLTPAA
jgi:succinoglycan biosynthesis transport protein ExoP